MFDMVGTNGISDGAVMFGVSAAFLRFFLKLSIAPAIYFFVLPLRFQHKMFIYMTNIYGVDYFDPRMFIVPFIGFLILVMIVTIAAKRPGSKIIFCRGKLACPTVQRVQTITIAQPVHVTRRTIHVIHPVILLEICSCDSDDIARHDFDSIYIQHEYPFLPAYNARGRGVVLK